MSIKPAKVQVNGGELSPWLEGRTDIAKYDKTAKLCRNFIPLAEGSLKRRGGTRFVAPTPEAAEVTFKIVALPEEAKVFIDNVQRKTLKVARGDRVSFEVTADGYAGQSGEATVTDDMTLKVHLVSFYERARLTITTVPDDATVKIDGIVRRSFDAYKNSEVPYLVYKNGYDAVDGKVLMDEDKELTVTLQSADEGSGSYGDWGVPQYFVACTAVGRIDKMLKCFCFRFSNGYLAVVFNSKKVAPDETAEWMFFKTVTDGYDSLLYKKGKYYLACLHCTDMAYYYNDVNGEMIGAYNTSLEMKVCGWQIDEDGDYASFYTRYDGSVAGAVVKVYYNGKTVWIMKERKNG